MKPAEISGKEPSIRISVVMATYNGGQYLAAQIDSILSQTLAPFELVIVDDGSTDNTLAIIRQYQEKHAHLFLYENEENLGYIKNFEKGMQLATGDLIALSDQDDVWHTEKLATLISNMGTSEIVYSDSELIDESGKLLGKKMSEIRNMVSYDDCLMYAVGAWAPGHAMLFRKELVARCLPFPSQVTHDFWLGFVASCRGTVQFLPQSLVYYRQHDSNAIGANTHADRPLQLKPSLWEKKVKSRERMELLYQQCPAENVEQKRVLAILAQTYRSQSLAGNWLRMMTFFRHRHKILAFKKKSNLMKWLFCVKMFFKID